MKTDLIRPMNRITGRVSSHGARGDYADTWLIPAGSSRVIADIRGPAQITHIWMTQTGHYREVLLKITWDNAKYPSVLCPLGDFFCLGHGMVNSFQSMFFSASARRDHARAKHGKTMPPIGGKCALNCYVPMPFRKRAVIELINEGSEDHWQYFNIDYESLEPSHARDTLYFHAEFRRYNPLEGWPTSCDDAFTAVSFPNKKRAAWNNNYVILDTVGRGHYIGCNLSVTNFHHGKWWGEGYDMIWVDGYKWPPDIHGTGSEDFLNQAWETQPNAFMRNGSSIYEHHTGGYQTGYVFHPENPVRFRKSIRVTIEHGHANQLRNEMSSVAYWYAQKSARTVQPPPVAKRLAVLKDRKGNWIHDCGGEGYNIRTRDTSKDPGRPESYRGRSLAVPRLKQGLALSDVADSLARVKPLVLGEKEPVGEVRFGVSGSVLAVHARLFDTKVTPCHPNFWDGSVFEIFGAQSATGRVGQVIFLPGGRKFAQEARVCTPGKSGRKQEVKWNTRAFSKGYEVAALIPLRALAIGPGSTEFMLDASVGVTADTNGVRRRAGVNGWEPPYLYNRIKVSKTGNKR